MAEYYNNQFSGYRRESSRKKRSFWLTMLDIVILIISVVATTTLLVIFVSRFFEPDKLWYFSLVGLITPIIYLVTIAVSLYWIIRWRWKMFIFTAIFVALGWPYVSLYYKIKVGKSYGEPRYERGNTKILSYNIRYLRDDEWLAPTTDSIVDFIRRENPDIICFQEYPVKTEEKDRGFELLSKYNRTEIRSLTDDGVICFTKYKIIRTDSISGFCGTGKGLWADLKIHNDTVRLFNIHLQTTSIKPADRDYISNKEFLQSADSGRVSKFADMAQRLYENSHMRSHQVDAIRHNIEHCPYPVIICGDFNDVPMSYTYRTIASKLTDTFSEQGEGYAHTFRGFFDLLRIDYILVSKQFRTLSYQVFPLKYSDHYPVMARVILRNE